MHTLLHDLRYALRLLLRTPGFTAVAVGTMAVGIGINTTIFSVVNAVLIRSVPGVSTTGLVALRGEREGDGGGSSLSAPDFADLRERVRAFEDAAAYHDRRVILTGKGGEPEAVEAEAVTANLFPLLGVKPLLGRVFTAEEGTPGRGAVTLLSHAMWTRRFGGDPAILGQTITLNGVPHTVVGVMPPRFGWPDNQPLWVPFSPERGADARGDRYLRVVARLRPGVSLEAAQAEAAAASSRLAREFPATNARWTTRVLDFDDAFAGPVRPVLLVMMGAVGFVLLIACANVANLFLARAAGRGREIAVRSALGAGRGRLVRQLLAESALVALAGGVLGVGVANWSLALVAAAFPFQPPLWLVFSVDGPALLFTLAVALGTGLLFGIVPALRATRTGLVSTLKDGGRGASGGRRGGRLRAALAVAELSLATVLLVGALLMTRSFLRLQGVDPGFDPAGTLAVWVVAGGPRYQEPEARNALARQLAERAAALPGVRVAALADAVPLNGGTITSSFRVEGRPTPEGGDPPADVRGVSEGFFGALGIPLVRGRAPTAQEVMDGAPVAVVSETMAARYFPGGDALGRRVSTGGPWLTVVGVARDIRLGRLDDEPRPQVYGLVTSRAPGAFTLLLRTESDPAALAPAARRIVHELDPAVPVEETLPVVEVVRRSLWQQRLFGGLFLSFAGVALVLAVSGVYGVMAYSVSQRTHEIGVRMALGARVPAVVGMVVGEGARLAALGLGIGLAGAFGVTRLLASQLYGVSATDPATFAAVGVLLVAVAVAASWVPARRATRVDPVAALRAE
jgi:predicted permease